MQERNSGKMNKLIRASLITLLVNILYFSFFYQQKYKPITIAVNVTAVDTTTVWYVYKDRFSNEKHFSEKSILSPGEEFIYYYDLNSSSELELLGLYWRTPEPSSIGINDFYYFVDKEKLISKKLNYVSDGSIVNEDSNGFFIKSKNKSNWVMLGSIDSINENRESAKHRSVLPIFYSVLIFLMFAFVGDKNFNCFSGFPREFNNLNSGKVYLLSVWVFIMPYWLNLSHVVLGILVLLSLIEIFCIKNLKVIFEVIKNHRFFYFFYFSVIISSLVVSSSEDILKAMIDYSYFILVPFIFVNISNKQLNQIFKFFELGMVSYVAILSLNITILYFQLFPDINYLELFRINSNLYWHSSYLSAFIVLIYLKRLYQKKKENRFIHLLYIIGVIFVFIIGARMGFLILCSLILLKLINLPRYATNRKFLVYLLGSGALLILGMASWIYSEGVSINEFEMIDARFNIWETSFKVIKENPIFGVGIDNTIESLSNAFNNEVVNVKYRNYNAHNSFIEILMGCGIISFIMFILIFRQLFKRGTILTCGFGLCCILLFMVESYLQRQAGMIFFTFWSCFLLNYKNKYDAQQSL